MDFEVIGSTKPGHKITREEALDYCAKIAGECYTEKKFREINKEKPETTQKRMDLTLGNGHHSVYGHVSLNIEISGLPKILAMILNNEKVYTTSEKSARYTEMKPTPEEKAIYNEWMTLLEDRILEVYPNIEPKKREKLAQENARYMTSVFTPTNMVHSMDFRQLNYAMHWFNDFINKEQDTAFNSELKRYMNEFNNALNDLYVEELDPDVKVRGLSMFAGVGKTGNSFSDTYSTVYFGSMAQLAQAQRHRTLHYNIDPIVSVPTDFIVPPIIVGKDDLVDKWLSDINSVANNYPQGMLVKIRERGTYEDFISKCAERLCGQAQLEIALQTKETLEKYLLEKRIHFPEIYDELALYDNGPRCTFPGYSCTSPCSFGKKGLERLI